MRKAGTITAVALSILLALSSVCPLEAADAVPNQYLSLKLGGYFPQHKDMKDYNDGFNGEIYYGRFFHQNFASELGAGYFKSDSTDTKLGDITIKTFDILYNIKGVYRIGRAELFAGPGVGIYFVKGYEFNTGTATEWKPAFGYHVLAGCNFDVTKEWFVGIEGKYFWATTKDPMIPQGGTFGTHLDGIMATATAGWRF